MTPEKHPSPQKIIWAFTPPLPLNTSPYFHFPSKIVDWAGWLLRSWLPLTERLVFFALAWARFSSADFCLKRCELMALRSGVSEVRPAFFLLFGVLLLFLPP